MTALLWPQHSHAHGPEMHREYTHRSDQIRSAAQSCPTLCDPMNRSTPGLPVHHHICIYLYVYVCREMCLVQSIGSQRLGHNLAPKQQQGYKFQASKLTEFYYVKIISKSYESRVSQWLRVRTLESDCWFCHLPAV